MNCEIQNLTRRLVSVHCNSGKTCHLPPGYIHELPEQEVIENPSVKKLVDRKMIVVRSTAKTSSPEPKSREDEASETAEKASGGGKSSRKKSPATKE